MFTNLRTFPRKLNAAPSALTSFESRALRFARVSRENASSGREKRKKGNKMEFTLEDTYETLKETRDERKHELNVLMRRLANSTIERCSAISFEEVKSKQQKLWGTLLNHVLQEEPKDYPLPATADLYAEIVTGLENAVRDARNLLDLRNSQKTEITDNIRRLQEKKEGFEKMREANIETAKLVANKTYSEEVVVAKRLFRLTKTDLHSVVDILFPAMEFQEMFNIVSSAYLKGGDDLYVDITSFDVEHVKCLVELDIAMYHPHDKTRIKLCDML